MPVHLYCQCAEMTPLMDLAKEHGLRALEDAIQAIGSEDSDGRRAGSIGDIGCFSFFPSKNLGAFGDAGMCVTNDAKLAEKMKILRVHGRERRYYHSVVGGNFRPDALQAAILSIKIKHLDKWTAKRQRNSKNYDERFAGLGSVMQTPSVRGACRHIHNQYTIRVVDRDGLKEYLIEKISVVRSTMWFLCICRSVSKNFAMKRVIVRTQKLLRRKCYRYWCTQSFLTCSKNM